MKNVTLENGLKVIIEKNALKNTTISVLVRAGLSNETDYQNGISHFIEHCVFKGTTEKTALQLTNDIEKLGGQCNAYTSDDHTMYYVNLLPEYYKDGIDFITDIIQNSIFPEQEIDKERNVVIQEIFMSSDDTQHIVWKNVANTFYNGQTLGRTILGPIENVERFTREDIFEYLNTWYVPNNMVISICGNIDEDEVFEYLLTKLNMRKAHKLIFNTSKFIVDEKFYSSDLEQSHVVVALPGPEYSNKDRIYANMFKNIMSGGMSTRLFQEMREKHGLAYNTAMLSEAYVDSGYMSIYTGTTKENVNKVIDLSKKLLLDAKTNITEDELEKAKNLMLFGLALKYDDSFSVAHSNGIRALFDLPLKNYETIYSEIKAVSLNDIFDFTNKYIVDNFGIVVTSAKE